MRENLELLRLLVAKLCDEELSNEERERLNDLLRESPALRREYSSLLGLHTRLITHPQLPEATPSPTPKRGNRALLLSTALWAGLCIALFFFLPRYSEPTQDVGFVSIIRAADCDWQGYLQPVEGEVIGESTLQIREGSALLRFPDGIEITLSGPAEIEIESPTSATLHSGNLFFTNSNLEDESAFSLYTPQGQVSDVGTSYTLAVNAEGAEEVHVVEGIVIRTDETGKQAKLLAGEARRWEAEGQSKAIPFAANNLPRVSKRTSQQTPDAWYSFTRREGQGFLSDWTAWGISEVEGRSIEKEYSEEGFQPTERAVIAARLEEPIDLRKNGVTYFSLHGHLKDVSKMEKSIYFAFREFDSHDNKAVFTMTPKRRTIGAKLKTADNDHSNKSTMALVLPRNHSQFQLAGKIISRSDEPDQLFLRLIPEDEPLSSDEPFAWSVVGMASETDFQLDLISLHLLTHGQIAISDVNFGRTWQSVTAPLRK